MSIRFWLISAFLVLVYLCFLSFNLLSLPLYLDEGLYIFWSYLFSTDTGFAYISMQDGKTPLFIWAVTFFNQWINNFLLTGRAISVAASAISLICWSIITFKILGKKSLVFLFILFLVTPFNILISRLAFVDSLLIAFGSLSILGIYLLRESVFKRKFIRSLTFAFLAGISLGLAFFTKTTAKIFLLSEIIILIFWGVGFIKHRNFRASILLGLFGVMIVAIYFEMQGYIKFGALRYWEMISNKESVLVFNLGDLYRKFLIQHDFSTHVKNIPVTLEYLFYYLGGILFFFGVGVFWIFKQRKNIWILILIFVLFSGVFLSAKVPASRYLAIIVPPVLTVSSFGLFWIWQRKSKPLKILSVILIIVSAFLSLKMIADPINAYYSSDDRANFAEYNLNALGLNESIEFLEPRKENAEVAVTGIWGVAEGADVRLREKGIKTYRTANVVVVEPKKEMCELEFKELNNTCYKIDFGDIKKSQKEKYVYFINELIDIETLKKLENVELVKEFVRPNTGLRVYLLRLN